MKNKKIAFTLSELFITLALIFTIMAMLAPTIINKMPDTDKAKMKQTYAQILKNIETMLNNPQLYPDASGFANTSPSVDTISGDTYAGDTKFADIFMSNLNITKITNVPANSNIAVSCTGSEANSCNRKVNNNTTICFITNNGIKYCIPKNTSSFFNNATPYSVAVIKVYLSDDDSDEAGYYISVTATGKVSVLPLNLAFGNKPRCEDNDIYKQVNQCKLNDYLLSIKD